ncbi:hypothetical protein [Planktothrix agardhii]|jgi:hypothetical protein|nr:hypothetical protein [Planktothrix agardhii]BBD54205.1 hypothetical protein NIES204_14940 [Planktothrix agardhii NIES-204]
MVRPFQELSGNKLPLFLVDSGNKLEFPFWRYRDNLKLVARKLLTNL